MGFSLICQSTTSMYSVLKNCKVWWNIKEWKMIKLETNEPNLSMRQTWFCEKILWSLPNLWKEKNRGVGEGKGETLVICLFSKQFKDPNTI